MATGRKTGGRQKGTPNKKTAEMLAEIAAAGEMPLDYMLRVMRDPTADNDRRDNMARAAAPYCHPRLAQIDHSGEIKQAYVARIPAPVTTVDEWLRQHRPPSVQ
jgi:hypothetical protein